MQLESEHRKHTVKRLLIGWSIIIASYLVIRMLFILFGIISVTLLGSLLAIVPYLLATLYLGSNSCQSIGYDSFVILFPCIVEKIVLYLIGAICYDISPIKFRDVFQAIGSKQPYINIFPQPGARSAIEISFLGWKYIVGSVVLSLLLVGLLVLKKKSIKM